MIAGTDIAINGTTLVVPPLNLRLYFEFEKELEILMAPAKHTNAEYLEAAINVFVADIRRNYPEFNKDALMELAYPDIPDLVKALFIRAGFNSVPLGAAQEPVKP